MIKKKEIKFPNGNRAQLVRPAAGTPAADILKKLGIEQPEALIMIIGGADNVDESLNLLLVQLFSRGIARTAAETGAMIIDGGTKAGVMELMGLGVADRGGRSILLGVAPAGRVTYPRGPKEGSIPDGAPLDPNHSHFVLADCDKWGCEDTVMFELAQALAQRTPVVTILVNGGEHSKNEVLKSIRQGWPLIIIEKTGRLADEIAAFWKEKVETKKDPCIEDPVMAEIIADGNIQLFPLDCPLEKMDTLIHDHFARAINPTLELAWERFALYDANAMQQQKSFKKLQNVIIGLGVFATALVVTQAQLNIWNLIPAGSILNQSFRYVIILIPITISVLVAAANRFKADSKWVLLRASAEAIKREIFRYRVLQKIKENEETEKPSCEARLAEKLKFISQKLMQTEVNLDALSPYEGPIPPEMYGAAAEDDGFGSLTPEDYITIRLGDQLSYYQHKTNDLKKELKRWQWLIYIF
ncbi:MAG: DUF4231 domain-containing protein, partial [Candidatus Omnitrophica bacterium]|nr:DUF4231 domain-containing protein [Candidatus Omnitrophota bacterium]